MVTPPSYRFDIEIEEDLIEEVARIYGFERIPARPPVAESEMRPTDEARRSQHVVRHAVAARDYQEVINFAFVEEKWERDFAANDNPIRLLNPIASQLAVMRSTLIGGLLDKVRYNLNCKAGRVRLFEVGRVFHRDGSVADGGLTVAGYRQPMMVAGIAYGPAFEEQWGVATRPVDFFDVKGDVESLFHPRVARFEPVSHPALHPGRAARVLVDGKPVGVVGELHPRWLQEYELAQAPVLFELELQSLREVGLPAYSEISSSRPWCAISPSWSSGRRVRRTCSMRCVQRWIRPVSAASARAGAVRRVPSEGQCRGFQQHWRGREKPCVPGDLARYWVDPAGRDCRQRGALHG